MADIPAYHRDPRLRRLDTRVVDVGEQDGAPWAVLADTILYPGGGGQPDDRGTVGGVAVSGVHVVDGRIRHVLASPVEPGEVTVELDWTRRLDHMQQHTGQHLLTAVAERDFGWPTTSFHLGERLCDIELDVPAIAPGLLVDLEDAVAEEIRAAVAVTTRWIDAERYRQLDVRSRGLPEGHTGDVRLVEIEGIDVNTCGGTHCASTAEIELVALLGTESLRGGTRLSWVAGQRARRLLHAHHARTAELRDALGASDEELVARTRSKLEQLRDAERGRRALEEELADALAAGLAAEASPLLVAHWPERGLPFLQRVAREAVRRAPDRVVLVTAGTDADGAFVLASGDACDLDLGVAGRAVTELLEGRGGGSGRIFQGKAARISGRDRAARAIEQLLAGGSER